MGTIFAFVVIMWTIPLASTAPALSSSTCHIMGNITSVSNRVQAYTPESWRLSWGLPESRTYIDVEMVNLILVSSSPGCEIEALREKTFQLRDNDDRKSLEIGQCITAQTQFSGDEFAIGQWLWSIKNCEEKN